MTDLAQRPERPIVAPVGHWQALRTRVRRFRELAAIALRSPTTVFGAILILALVTMAICAPLIMEPNFPDPYQMPRDWAQINAPPGTPGHPLGTTPEGGDVLYGIVWGARTSLKLAFMVVGLTVVIGIIIGSLAGFLGGKVDEFLMRVVDVFLAVPELILALAIAALLGPSFTNIIIAITVLGGVATPASSERRSSTPRRTNTSMPQGSSVTPSCASTQGHPAELDHAGGRRGHPADGRRGDLRGDAQLPRAGRGRPGRVGKPGQRGPVRHRLRPLVGRHVRRPDGLPLVPWLQPVRRRSARRPRPDEARAGERLREHCPRPGGGAEPQRDAAAFGARPADSLRHEARHRARGRRDRLRHPRGRDARPGRRDRVGKERHGPVAAATGAAAAGHLRRRARHVPPEGDLRRRATAPAATRAVETGRVTAPCRSCSGVGCEKCDHSGQQTVDLLTASDPPDARDPRQSHLDDLPGSGQGAEPGADDPRPGGRGDSPNTSRASCWPTPDSTPCTRTSCCVATDIAARPWPRR